MANNDDLDDFFKKKDRKGNKAKKATGILANNKELLKQLEIVTSATSAFKENPELEDEDEENLLGDETLPPTVAPAAAVTAVLPAKTTSKSDSIPLTLAKDVPQEEWEEFEASSSKIEELRAKFSRANDQDDFDDDEDRLVDHDESSGNAHEREQQKDKPVWKLDQVKANETGEATSTTNRPVEETPRPVSPVKPAAPATGSTYRPPHLRGNASTAAVTVVSGAPSAVPSKKKQPNIASTEEFPTLGAAVNKK